MAESFISLYPQDSYGTENCRKNLIEVVSSDENDNPDGFHKSDSNQFLFQMDLEKAFNEFSAVCKVSVAERCVHSLKKIRESTQSDAPIVISSSVAINKDIWELELYRDNERAFPVDNVALKVNVLRTVLSEIGEFSTKSNSQESIEILAKTLQYLSRLSQSFLVSPESAKPRMSSTGNTLSLTRNQMESKRDELQHRSTHAVVESNSSNLTVDASSTYSHKSSESKSISSSISKRSIFKKMKNIHWIQGRNLSNDTDVPDNLKHQLRSNNTEFLTRKPSLFANSSFEHRIRRNETYSSDTTRPTNHIMESSVQYKRQDMAAMPEYITSLKQLSTQILALPQTPQNDIIFSFLNKCIIPFILNDARLLQIEYLKTRIVNALR